MRFKNCYFIFAFLCAATCQNKQLLAQKPIDFIGEQAKIVSAEAERYRQTMDFTVSGAGANIDLKYHRCEWRVDPSVRFISGTITSYFKALTDVNTLSFDMSQQLQVRNVRWRGQSLTATRNGDLVEFMLPLSIPSGSLDSVSITYDGVPPTTGFGSFTTATHAGVPILATLSEPYGARDWFPCKMDLIDKIDSLDVIVTVPNGNRVASNGLLVREWAVSDTTRAFHWQHRYPIANYLIAIAVTNYVSFTQKIPLRNGDTLDCLNYAYPESLNTWQRDAPFVVSTMRLFDSLFGAYPFKREKYGHAQWNWGGGMEHQTMSFMSDIGWGLTAHELAHQWFGDKVTCGSFQDIFLNEGFATYLTGLSYEFVNTAFWRNWRTTTQSSALQRSGSVFVPDTTSVNRIFSGALSYNKGAYILHQLRWELGDSAFFSAIRNYLNDEQLAYNFARVSHLKTHFERTSRRDLTKYFNDWYYGEGFPTFDVRLCPRSAPNRYALHLNQTTSHPSVNFFELTLPLKIRMANGRDTLLRVAVVSRSVNPLQTYQIELPASPESITFDPELWVLAKSNVVAIECPSNNAEVLADNNSDLTLFPNPTTGKLWINLKNIQKNDFLGNNFIKIEVYNTSGQKILDNLGTKPNSDLFSHQIDTYQLSIGTYWLKISVGNKYFVQKFIKQ